MYTQVPAGGLVAGRGDDMLWGDKRIAKAAEEAEGSAAHAVDLILRVARDEYEQAIDAACDIIQEKDARIAELEQVAADRLRVMYEYGERIAEQDAYIESLGARIFDADKRIESLEVEVGYYKESARGLLMQCDQKDARAKALEAEKQALKNYIESLEAQLTPAQIFDANA